MKVEKVSSLCRQNPVFLGIVAFLLAFFPSRVKADYEDQLLQRFQKQNQTAASQLREEATRTLAEAESQGRQDPVKLLERLRQTLGRLQSDVHLDKAERTSLIDRIKVRLRDVQKVVAEKTRQEAEALALEKGKKASRVKQFVAGPTIMRLNSSAVVPDGGTVILGGYSFAAEGRNEFGPPILGKIPYLGRLFRNVAAGRQLSAVRAAVSVRIISLEEEERKLLEGR